MFKTLMLQRFVVLVTICTCVGPAIAQPNDRGQLPDPKALLADRFVDLSRQVLGGQGPPSEAQYEQALILLDQATSLSPDNGEHWRLKIEALDLANRTEGINEAIRGYLRVRGDDDVVWLRLVLMMAELRQTAEQRVQFYEQIVRGRQGRKLSRALRSRVAYRAALLYGEQGNDEQFRAKITAALNLDATNKAAAAEAYRLLRDGKLTVRTQGLLTLFNADPTNPTGHRLIAETLLEVGLFELATQWYQSAAELATARGLATDRAVVGNWALAMWGAGRGVDAAALMQQAYAKPAEPKPEQPQEEPEEEPEEADEDDEDKDDDEAEEGEGEEGEAEAPVPELPAADELLLQSLPLDLQIVSTAIHFQRDPSSNLTAISFKMLADQLQEHVDANPNDAALLGDLAWVHLLFDRKLDQVSPWLEQLAKSEDVDPQFLGRLRGWHHLRSGQFDEARAVLSELRADDALAAFGLCQIPDEPAPQKVAELTRIVGQAPATSVGILALYQLIHLGGQPPLLPDARTVQTFVQQIPEKLRLLARTPLDFVQLRARVDQFRYTHGQPMMIELQLRNISRIPIALGDGQTVPTRLFILPKISVGAASMPPLPPIVVDLRRRLRLQPGQAVVVRVRGDVATVRAVLDANPASVVRVHFNTILNPRLLADGRFVPGLMGTAAAVRNLERRTWVLDDAGLREALAQIGALDRSQSMVRSAMMLHVVPGLARRNPDAARGFADVVSKAFATMDEVQQAWAITHVPIDPRLAPLFEPMMTIAQRSENPQLQLAVLATQAVDPDAPVLNAALRTGKGQVRRFAEARRDMLRAIKATGEEGDEAAEAPPQPPAEAPDQAPP